MITTKRFRLLIWLGVLTACALFLASWSRRATEQPGETNKGRPTRLERKRRGRVYLAAGQAAIQSPSRDTPSREGCHS